MSKNMHRAEVESTSRSATLLHHKMVTSFSTPGCWISTPKKLGVASINTQPCWHEQDSDHNNSPIPCSSLRCSLDILPGNGTSLCALNSAGCHLKPLEPLKVYANKSEIKCVKMNKNIKQYNHLVCFVREGKVCDLDLTNTPEMARHLGALKQPDMWATIREIWSIGFGCVMDTALFRRKPCRMQLAASKSRIPNNMSFTASNSEKLCRSRGKVLLSNAVSDGVR